MREKTSNIRKEGDGNCFLIGARHAHAEVEWTGCMCVGLLLVAKRIQLWVSFFDSFLEGDKFLKNIDSEDVNVIEKILKVRMYKHRNR